MHQNVRVCQKTTHSKRPQRPELLQYTRGFSFQYTLGSPSIQAKGAVFYNFIKISFHNTSLGHYLLWVPQLTNASLKSQYYHSINTQCVAFVFLSLGYIPQTEYFWLCPFTCKIHFFLTAQFHCLYEPHFYCLWISYMASSLFSHPVYHESSSKLHEHGSLS